MTATVAAPGGGNDLDPRLLRSVERELRGLAEQIVDPGLRSRVENARGLVHRVLTDLAADPEQIGELVERVAGLVERDDASAGSGPDLAATVRQLQDLRAGREGGADGADEAATSPPAAGDQLPHAEDVTAYLRERFPGSCDVAHTVGAITGGFSKRTLLVSCTLDGVDQEIVLRQIPTGRHARSLGPEYEVVRAVHAAGLPAPETLWYEPDEHSLGGAFFATRRARGETVGTVWGAEGVSPELCLDVAEVYARLHALDTDGLTPPVSARSTPAELTAMISWQESTLDKRGLSGDPVLAALFDWLRANVPEAPPRASLIHGDAAFSNLLVDGDSVTAVLDWEASHLGDPAEELAYLRQSVDTIVPWPDFLDRYVAAGGRAPSESTMHFYEVWSHVWRHAGCLWLSQDYDRSGRYASAVAAYVHGPRFLDNAVVAAFEPSSPTPTAPDEGESG